MFAPASGTWILKDDINIYNKTKILSIIASSKNVTSGHKLRHNIINKYKNKNIELFGFGGYGYENTMSFGYNPIEYKLDGLKDYAFSLTIENTKKDYYFTEKLIDCFVTGTVPIYWGCPSIGDFFNINGMIIFDNIDELDEILNNLTIEKYNSMKDAIFDNFEKVKNFSNEPIEYIYNNYLEIFNKYTK